MDKEHLKVDIIDLVKRNGSMSIKEIARIYYECQYISKRETRSVIKELIDNKILVRVDDVDCFGNKVDDVTINE